MEALKNDKRTPNPFVDANIISKFLLWYMNNSFAAGSSRLLEKTDVHDITEDESSQLLSDELEKIWEKEKKGKRKPSFFWCLFKMRGCSILFYGILMFVVEFLRVAQAIFLKNLIQELSSPEFGEDKDKAYYWATSLAISQLIVWALLHQTFLFAEKIGIRLKCGCVGLIYKKILRLSNCSLGQITSGHIVTLISSDVHKVQEGFKLCNYIWIAPLELVAVVFLLWREIGPSCLAGIGILVLTIPVQVWFGKFFANMRLKTVARTDKRVNIMNEVISSMQVTKMYTWEESFAAMVNEVRRDESSRIMKTAMVRSLNNSMYSVSPYLVSLATFSLFYYYGSGMTLALVFLLMSLFFAIRLGVVLFFPMAVQMLMEAYVSCNRLQRFLLADEQIAVAGISKTTERAKSTDASLIFKNVTATWSKDSNDQVISDLSFNADSKNSLLMIVGPVGSGKSSILMAIMNELQITRGEIDTTGSIGYAAQQPWIFSGTLRRNILFGKEFDKKRYEKTISACALNQDIASFEKGDLTLVGERGVSLSGGQKARIGLARAVYRDADIYLLDDPLSAVDTKVGKHIFEKCIKGLLHNKVVILVTHQIQYLEHATDIICLKEDATVIEGSLHELSHKGVDIVGILHPESREKKWDHDSAIETEDSLHYSDSSEHKDALSGITLEIGDRNKGFHGSHQSLNNSKIDCIEDEEVEESRSKGSISMKLYVKYIVQGVGWLGTVLLIIMMLAGQIMLTMTDYWLAEWADGEQQRNDNVTITSRYYIESDPDINLFIFAALVGVSFLFNFFRSAYFYITFVKSSRQLHNEMFQAILKAPMYFFDTNPVGQILNRFSRDIYFMDDELPWTFHDFAYLSLLSFAIVILNCVSVPYLTVLVIPLLIIFLYARRYYMKSSRQLRRLEAISRSPLYTHVSSTLAGITTIRSFDIKEKILQEFYRCQDYQTGAWVMYLAGSRWFSMRLDFLAILFSICSLYAPIVASSFIDIDAGLVAVSLTYLLSLCGMFQWAVRQSAEVDNLMTSVERVFEYAGIEPEPDHGSSKELRNTWPEYGLITGEGASFAYHSSLPYVLKKLYFCIRPMEKVGIVGRTGAGKSSLLSMLFRLGNVTGTIRIDGYPISDLKLKDLRKTISVIPQDPVMFSGSLRKNLDPFKEYTDADIWEALEEVQMKETIMELPNKLHTEISEAGSNVSVGERQLLCLARALLKKNKILVIDEATANVDMETDALIQQTIREKFKECTVLTVAHRLNTVMDSDRVMVMESGKIAEFDEPYQLLQNRAGYFRKLVDQAGRNEASRLELLAEEAKQLRHLMVVQQQEMSYPGSHVTLSRSKSEILDHFGTRVIYETTL